MLRDLSSFRGIVGRSLGVMTLLLLVASPAAGQAGECAGCQNCWECKGGLLWGVENCDMSGGPQCPCRNIGDACNPDDPEGRILVDGDGVVRLALRLDATLFGRFDCETGTLTALYRQVAADQFVELPAAMVSVYGNRVHAADYLDVTGAWTWSGARATERTPGRVVDARGP